MATGGRLTWRLKKFSHSKKEAGKWTDYEADHGKPELMFNIAESGYVWVTQSQELLDFAVLPGGAANVRVQRKSDTLVIRSSIQGESRVMRLMFAGGSREEAVEQCSRAAAKLKQFDVCPVETPPAPNQPLTEPCSAAANQTGPVVGEVVGTEPEVDQASPSIRHLAQGLLGERTLSLPEMYRHRGEESEDLGPFVRMCLLDPAFPAYVEEVERELKKLAQD